MPSYHHHHRRRRRRRHHHHHHHYHILLNTKTCKLEIRSYWKYSNAIHLEQECRHCRRTTGLVNTTDDDC